MGTFTGTQVLGFVVDPATGALTSVPGPPATVPGGTQKIVGDSVRRSVYIAPGTATPGQLQRFNVDPATGALLATPLSIVPGYPEQGGALHPQLPILYMTDPTFEAVRAYRVNEPCCIVDVGVVPGWNNVHGADVHPSGRFLYTTTTVDNIVGNSSHLWGYAIDPGTGLLTPLPGSPWLDSVGQVTTNLRVEASGRFVYAVHRAGALITAFGIDQVTGALTPFPGAPISTPGFSEYLTITASGRFLYVTHPLLDLVSGFAIGPDAQLTPVPGSPFPVGDGPQELVTAGSDRFLYVAGQFSAIWGYSINPATGTLSPLPGQPFPSPGHGQHMARVSVPSLDPQPTLIVDDTAVTEGHTGFVSAVFTVHLANPPAGTVTVGYETVQGTALMPSDFSYAAGLLTFTPGIDSRQVFVEVHGDVVDEPDEFLSLVLSSPSGASLGDAEGVARIRDDDAGAHLLTPLERNADFVTNLGALPGPVADEDLYLITREPYSSYEVVVDAASGDVGSAGPLVELLSPELTAVMTSGPVGTGHARTLRIDNFIAARAMGYVRVRSAGCSTDCGADDAYRIRLRETTGVVPRFNETGGQVTVLVLQNVSDRPLVAHPSYWDAAGVRLDGSEVTLAPHASAALPTPPGAQGHSGSITVSHDGALGALAGKAVSLDPASGLAFDTPLATRPH